MEEQLVGFEVAKAAKWNKKSFDIPCRHSFNEINREEFDGNSADNWNTFRKFVSRPTQSLLQKWLRELPTPIVVTPYTDFVAWEVEIAHPDKDRVILSKNKEGKWFNSYEEALEAGLLESLKLI